MPVGQPDAPVTNTEAAVIHSDSTSIGEKENGLTAVVATPIKKNFDVSLKVGDGSKPFVSIPTSNQFCLANRHVASQHQCSVLRYSKFLDEMFESITSDADMPPVTLCEARADTFLQFYWWAIRDPRYAITEDNVRCLLKFIDKFDIPLLLNDVIRWTKTGGRPQNAKSCASMMFNCLRINVLAPEFGYWYQVLNGSLKGSAGTGVFALLASDDFELEVGDSSLVKLIRGLVHASHKESAKLPTEPPPNATFASQLEGMPSTSVPGRYTPLARMSQHECFHSAHAELWRGLI